MEPNAEDIIKRLGRLETDRSNFSYTWQDCTDYGMPGNSQITNKRSPGTERIDTFQTVGENSVIQLAANLYSYMFPIDSKAFILKIDNRDLAENDEIKQWLHTVTEILHYHLIQSNFRQAFFENLKALVLFGTSCLYCNEGTDQFLNFTNFYMGDIYIDVDNNWNPDTVYRKIEYTARQAVQEFGEENLGQKILAVYRDPTTIDNKFKFIHAVEPNPNADGKNKDPWTMDFASIYVSVDDKKIVGRSGYPEEALIVARFDRDASEKYGRSPMMKELPDIKLLSEMKMVEIKASEKACDPPIVTPDDGSIWPLATQPGGQIHMTPGGEKPFWFKYEGDLGALHVAIERITKDIKDGFFLGLFELPDEGPQKTATEALIQRDSKQRTSTPIVGRLQSELFNPLIHRMIGLLNRAGALPEMPEEMGESDYKIEYLGQLALAMKTLESQAFVKTMEELRIAYGQMEITEYLDNFDIDESSRNLARNNGVPATWLKDTDLMAEERQVRAAAEQRQREVEQAQMIAAAAKDGGTAPEEGSLTERTLKIGSAA